MKIRDASPSGSTARLKAIFVQAHRRGTLYRFALPLTVLFLMFVLAAFRPGNEQHSSSVSQAIVPIAQARSSSHLPTAMGAALFAATSLAGAYLVFLFFRLLIRRPGKSEHSRVRERSHSPVLDYLMVALLLLVGALVFYGLRGVARAHPQAGVAAAAAPKALTVAPGRPSAPPAQPPAAGAVEVKEPVGPLVALVLLEGFLVVFAMIETRRGRRHFCASTLGIARRRAGEPEVTGHGAPANIRGAYATMRRILEPIAAARGADTPREYTVRVRRAGVICPAIETITSMFEIDRYTQAHKLPSTILTGAISESEGEYLQSLLDEVKACAWPTPAASRPGTQSRGEGR